MPVRVFRVFRGEFIPAAWTAPAFRLWFSAVIVVPWSCIAVHFFLPPENQLDIVLTTFDTALCAAVTAFETV